MTDETIRQDLVDTLGKLCDLMNAAQERDFKVEFAIAPDAHGKQAIQRFELWKKVHTQ